MPGYVIHLAIGKVYEQNNEIKDIESFERGIIAPDLSKDKRKSHYGPDSSNPDLNRYLRERKITNEFDEGYFLHLITDYLFYNKFLKRWNERIYDDYDKLNDRIIKKYNIVLLKKLLKEVKNKKGSLEVLDEAGIYRFIEVVGKINIREMLKENETSFQNMISEIQIEERDS